MSEKLQKVLARAGVGSRREMEDWIAAGRVSINGSIAKLGERVGGDEVIRVLRTDHLGQREHLLRIEVLAE